MSSAVKRKETKAVGASSKWCNGFNFATIFTGRPKLFVILAIHASSALMVAPVPLGYPTIVRRPLSSDETLRGGESVEEGEGGQPKQQTRWPRLTVLLIM